MTHVLVVPDSYKGSLTSTEVAEALATGVHRAKADAVVTTLPMADGVEGTVAAMVAATGERRATLLVTGPHHDWVTASYGVLDDGAVIEIAEAAGLPLTSHPNPETTTTYGVGELITALGDQRLLIGAGGSATHDLGCGAAAACGAKFYDAQGQTFIPTGATLAKISRIDVDNMTHPAEMMVMTDIDNPLLGDYGAAAVFAPQKGADAQMVDRLESGTAHAATIIARDVGVDVTTIPGGGAAGGFAAGMYALFSAALRPGIDAILDVVGFDEHAAKADLVLTGEGQLDGQTLAGKVPIGVARRTETPVIAVAGAIGDGAAACYDMGSRRCMALLPAPRMCRQRWLPPQPIWPIPPRILCAPGRPRVPAFSRYVGRPGRRCSDRRAGLWPRNWLPVAWQTGVPNRPRYQVSRRPPPVCRRRCRGSGLG